MNSPASVATPSTLETAVLHGLATMFMCTILAGCPTEPSTHRHGTLATRGDSRLALARRLKAWTPPCSQWPKAHDADL